MGFAIAAGVGAAVSAYGSYEQGQAASGMADAQSKQAQQYQGFISGQTQRALDAVGSGYTPAQMSAYDDALAKQESSVQRQEALAQSLSPALISAGKQMTSILNGQSAPVMQNLQNQRNIQRQGVIDQLKQQMGPGAETSTAGQQALQHFDAETSNMMTNTQQQYLSQMSGLVQEGGSLEAGIGQGNATLSNIQSMDPTIRANALKAQVIQGGMQASAPAQQAMINSAGASYIGQLTQGQMLQGLGKSGISAAGAYYGQQSMNRGQAPAPGSGGAGNNSGLLGSTFMNGGRNFTGGGSDINFNGGGMSGLQNSMGNQTMTG